MNRQAAVAGHFYPRNAAELRRLIGEMVDRQAPKERAIAVVAPHAGYIYSGPVAGAVYSSVELPSTVVILAPAHRPIRPIFALMTEGSWETPLGAVPVDGELAAAIKDRCPFVAVDDAAHRGEHSLEVQLPFIQYLRGDFSLVPIGVSPRASFDEIEELGRGVAAAVRDNGQDVLLVASTDMSHYLSAVAARDLDWLAIDRILALDPRGLYDAVRLNDISMCGVLPTTAVLIAAAGLGAARAELVRYATSGDVTGDEREVVAYAGFKIT